jgi:hypothetical protein
MADEPFVVGITLLLVFIFSYGDCPTLFVVRALHPGCLPSLSLLIIADFHRLISSCRLCRARDISGPIVPVLIISSQELLV